MNEAENNAYVDHLRTEHQHLDDDSQSILGSLVDSCEQQELFDPTNMTNAMLKLRHKLSDHFRVEEAGGCLEQAVSRCPELSSEANRIEAEHDPLLAELDDITMLALEAESKEAQDNVHERFQLFVHDLRKHEAAENRLLELAFGLEAD